MEQCTELYSLRNRLQEARKHVNIMDLNILDNSSNCGIYYVAHQMTYPPMETFEMFWLPNSTLRRTCTSADTDFWEIQFYCQSQNWTIKIYENYSQLLVPQKVQVFDWMWSSIENETKKCELFLFRLRKRQHCALAVLLTKEKCFNHCQQRSHESRWVARMIKPHTATKSSSDDGWNRTETKIFAARWLQWSTSW